MTKTKLTKTNFLPISVLALSMLTGCGAKDGYEPLPEETRLNDYPIVLLHGGGGWGDKELFGFKYWGGFKGNLEKELEKYNHDTRTVLTGPFSSYWDRACEFYAFIKGTKVDYGQAHADKFGHTRFGTDYTGQGIYEEWGELDSKGEKRKVHIIAHSFGGPAARTVVQLLEHGSPEEQSAGQPNLSPLFAGDDSPETRDLVKSVVTISAPHDGLSYIMDVGAGLPTFLLAFFYATDNIIPIDWIYDLKMVQWGLHPENKETLADYYDRVEELVNHDDFALKDVSIYGAKELNSWVRTQPNVYHFSYATSASQPEGDEGFHVPEKHIFTTRNGPMGAASTHMGSLTINEGPIIIDETWWPNDGGVNVISQNGPKLINDGLIPDVIVNYDPDTMGPPEKGVWNYRGVLDHVDHFDVIGFDPVGERSDEFELFDFYLELADELKRLPE
ncbi:MAG: lipase [Moraxellaceae bacterium]|nr:MAG: lipase [Moraxellaceae bacterium]